MKVYALRVSKQDETWPECNERQTRWCQPEEALSLIGEDGLRELIAKFASKVAKR